MADEASLWGDPTTLATLEELHAARAALQTYDDILRTPLLPSWPVGGARISLKLESLQTTGSFKIRGMRYKLHVSDVARLRSEGVVTLSAGNAGKAVAYLGQACGYSAKVFMPETAPDDRKRMMELMGATVVKVPGEPCSRRCQSLQPHVCSLQPYSAQVPGEDLLGAVAECIAAEQRVVRHNVAGQGRAGQSRAKQARQAGTAGRAGRAGRAEPNFNPNPNPRTLS